MPVKTKPVSGQSSWGNVLNTHLEQLIPNSGGGINTFDIFTDRPIYKTGTSTPLDADDVGLTYLFTQTGNLHRWSNLTKQDPDNNTVNYLGWKVLNEENINVKDYGAIGNGITDDTDALQYAIDLVTYRPIFNPYGYKNIQSWVYLPEGTYRITKSLFLGYPTSAGGFYWVTTQLKGASSTSSVYTASIIKTDFPSLDRPAICVEAQRDTKIENITILGQLDSAIKDYKMVDDLDGPISTNRDPSDKTKYVDSRIDFSNTSQRRYAPYAAIVSNAYSGNATETSAYPYPTVTIPEYLTSLKKDSNNKWFPNSSTNKGDINSSHGVLNNVKIELFEVGLLKNAFSGDLGDFWSANYSTFDWCLYGVSTTHQNERMLVIRHSSFIFCYYGVVSSVHGRQRGIITSLENIHWDLTYKLIDNNGGIFPVLLQHCYCERGYSYGEVNNAVLINCVSRLGPYREYDMPVITGNNVKCIGCSFAWNVGSSVESENGIPQMMTTNCIAISYESCYIQLIGENTTPILDSINMDYFFAAESTATITNTDIKKLAVASLVFLMRGIINMRNWQPLVSIIPNQIHTQVQTRFQGNAFYGVNASKSDKSFLATSSGSSTYTDRIAVPYGMNKVEQSLSMPIEISTQSQGFDIKYADFTSREVIVGGIRNMFLDLIYNPNVNQRPLLKGAIISVLTEDTSTKPVVAVCIQNPNDTGVANKYSFLVIHGYDGNKDRTSNLPITLDKVNSADLTSFLQNNPVYNWPIGVVYCPDRIVMLNKRLVAQFTTGSNQVVFGFDISKCLKVKDSLYVDDIYGVLPNSMVYNAHITAIAPDGLSITISRNATGTNKAEIGIGGYVK